MRKSRGFTLVEVLAALVLVAIVLPVIMRGIALSATLASTSKEKSEAAVLAKSKLDELIATHGWQGSALSGDFDAHPEYRWSAEVRDWDSSSLKELDVHVIWTARGSQRQVTLSTLLDSNTD